VRVVAIDIHVIGIWEAFKYQFAALKIGSRTASTMLASMREQRLSF